MKDSCTHHLLKNVLSSDDLEALISKCQEALDHKSSLSSYIFLEDQESPIFSKIKRLVEEHLSEAIYYLNDFYFYTDETFQADWHVDTEMFAFQKAVNVWIPLSPDEIESPLAFIREVNSSTDSYYHSLRLNGDQCNFVNFANFSDCEYPLEVIEENRIIVPQVRAGDVLLINPKRFHRTGSNAPKHAFVLKFVMPENGSFKAEMPVPDAIWPEVKVFEDIMSAPAEWGGSLSAIKQKLNEPETRSVMTEGFFPEKLSLFKAMVKEL